MFIVRLIDSNFTLMSLVSYKRSIILILFLVQPLWAFDPQRQAQSPRAQIDSAVQAEGAINAIEAYQTAAQMDLMQERYEKLEKLAAELRKTKARFPGGAWKLNKLYQGMNIPIFKGGETEREWEVLLAKLKKWVAKDPRSITARVSLGSAYTEYAWSAFGSGGTGTASEEDRRLYQERNAMARRILEEARGLPEKCPHWYATLETVAIAQGWERPEFERIFDEGVAFAPEYHYLYTYKASYLLPRWYGKPGDVAKFAEETVARHPGDFGQILYYLIVREAVGVHRGKVFSDLSLSWGTTKEGFRALENTFGMNADHLNSFCRLAGWAEDREVAREMLKRIGDNWDPNAWENRQTFEEFKAWASPSKISMVMYFGWLPITLGAATILFIYRKRKSRPRPPIADPPM